MAYIQTVGEDQASGLLKELYQVDEKANGYVPNYAKSFSLNPEAYDGWKKMIGAIRSRMRLRRYELVTFATALSTHCSYWMLAHGAVLRKNFFSAVELIDIVKDFHHANLTDEEVTLMAFAQKIAGEAGSIREEDVEKLRRFGLSDAEILDVVLACTARIFFSKTLDALDARPDAAYQNLEPELVKALTIGRAYP